jgi:CRP/FNR family transcriptional regulator, cyclic AMP receptor protein
MTLLELLESQPFCRGLSQSQLAQLIARAHVERFPEDTIIFSEGAAADALYLITRGRVVLEQHIPGRGDFQLENLTAGDMLGLSWLFPGSSWVLGARAVELTEAVIIAAADIHALSDRDPVFGLAVAKHVIAQLYQRLERVRLQRLDVYRGPR